MTARSPGAWTPREGPPSVYGQPVAHQVLVDGGGHDGPQAARHLAHASVRVQVPVLVQVQVQVQGLWSQGVSSAKAG